MATFTTRPSTFNAVQWDGTNIVDFQNTFPWVTFIANVNGTLDCSGFQMPLTWWMYAAGNVSSDANFQTMFQGLMSGEGYAFASQLDIPERRVKNVPLPAFGLLNLKQTLTCTFDTPMPSTAYEVAIVFEGNASLVGALNPPMVIAGSKTTTGFQFAVSSLVILAIGTINARCVVVATPA